MGPLKLSLDGAPFRASVGLKSRRASASRPFAPSLLFSLLCRNYMRPLLEFVKFWTFLPIRVCRLRAVRL